VGWWDGKGGDVDVEGEGEGDEEVGGYYLDQVLVDEGPEREFRAVDGCSKDCS
jgi:hypothetical protein